MWVWSNIGLFLKATLDTAVEVVSFYNNSVLRIHSDNIRLLRDNYKRAKLLIHFKDCCDSKD